MITSCYVNTISFSTSLTYSGSPPSILQTFPLLQTQSSWQTIVINRWSWLTRMTPPSYLDSPRPRASIVSMSRWLVGSSGIKTIMKWSYGDSAATTYPVLGSLDCGRRAQRRPPCSSVPRRDSPPAGGPCLHSHQTGPASSGIPQPSYQGTPSASPLPGRLSGQFDQQNAGNINIKYLRSLHTITVNLCEVAKFQVPVSYPGAFPWIHHFHDDLQEGSFTRPILSHDTDT